MCARVEKYRKEKQLFLFSIHLKRQDVCMQNVHIVQSFYGQK